MTGAARLLAAMLAMAELLVPADRRDWVRAMRSEAGQVPNDRERCAWLVGGLRLAVRESTRGSRVWYRLAFAVAAATAVWRAWPGPSGDAAVAINRVDAIAVIVLLAATPSALRRWRGPMAAAWQPRLVRCAGYLAILGLVVVKAAVERAADAPPFALIDAPTAWLGEAGFLAIVVGYAAAIVACTAQRSVVRPPTLAAGVATGAVLGVLAYAVGPLGFPLRFAGAWPAGLYDAAIVASLLAGAGAPVLAAALAVRRLNRSGRLTSPASGSGQGVLAGLCAGGCAALVVSVLSTSTIALLPHDAGLRDWSIRHIGQWAEFTGHWTPILNAGSHAGYVAGNSAFAAGYLFVLLFGPVIGAALGGWGGLACARSGRTPEPGSGLGSARRAGMRRPRLRLVHSSPVDPR